MLVCVLQWKQRIHGKKRCLYSRRLQRNNESKSTIWNSQILRRLAYASTLWTSESMEISWRYLFLRKKLVCYNWGQRLIGLQHTVDNLSGPFWVRQAQREVVKIKNLDFSYWASSTPSHYEPKSPIRYDDINFVNFRFSKFFLAQIHLEILYFHRLGLKSFDFVGKCIIYLPKVSLKHPFF